MTVYVITKGEYSDYRICAVTLDASKAQKIARAYSDKFETAYVEEYESDSEANSNLLNGRFPYYVHFYKDKGLWAYCADGESAFKEEIIEKEDKTGLTNVTMTVKVYAENADKAKKIATDKRAKYLAEKAGIV